MYAVINTCSLKQRPRLAFYLTELCHHNCSHPTASVTKQYNLVPRKLGSKQAYRVVHQPVSRGFAVFADAWLSGWLAQISADLREAVAH